MRGLGGGFLWIDCTAFFVFSSLFFLSPNPPRRVEKNFTSK
jgi:hypothetical protein